MNCRRTSTLLGSNTCVKVALQAENVRLWSRCSNSTVSSGVIRRVFITENEINFLAFPRMKEAIVIFGAGYGWDAFPPRVVVG